MTQRSTWFAFAIGLALFVLNNAATAQGVDERMTTGAPTYGGNPYSYPAPLPGEKPTAVPTGPRSYLSRSPHPNARKPHYDYWDWPRSRARKLKRSR